MRIIAGRFKGRRLLSPPRGATTRPITGAVRKSLFDMLNDRVVGACVVDLYCGTGTLGLEALSRGAERCFFAERDAAVIQRLRRNIEAVGEARQCVVWRGDIVARLAGWMDGLAEHVDLAFVDPPYAAVSKWNWRQVTQRIFTPLAGCLADDGLVILRLPRKVESPMRLGALKITRTRSYGDMVLALYARADEGE